MSFRRSALVRALLVAAVVAVSTNASAQPLFDHLQCHKIKDSAPKVKYTANLTPEQNQFVAQTGCQVKVPAKLFCIDVEKSGVVPAPPLPINGQNTRDYLCYKLKCGKLKMPLAVEDQFGSRTITVKNTGYLCAPARVVGFPDPPTPTACVPQPTPTSTPAPPPTCTDGVKNGSETGVDCGGPMCPACPNGQGCAGATDCQSGLCQAGVCVSCMATAEVCNGMDDDCDTQIDEGLGQTTCGTGACQNTVQNCVMGMSQVCTPGTPTTETCNGIDDNCDGMVDNSACPSAQNAGGTCISNMCQYTCNAGYADCNNNVGTDGCEVNIQTDSSNCGSCGLVCPGGAGCANGQCKLLNGALCTMNSQCQNNSCVDGVCCNSACASLCQACSLAKNGVGNGTCANIPGGTDPDNECAGTQTCNGTGSCQP